jgi:hypothetical protein
LQPLARIPDGCQQHPKLLKETFAILILLSTVCSNGVEALAVDDLGLFAALVHNDFKSITFHLFGA